MTGVAAGVRYVLLASAALILLFALWRPITAPLLWDVQGGIAALLLSATHWIGWGLMLSSTFPIDHFELFGLKQVVARLRTSSLNH